MKKLLLLLLCVPLIGYSQSAYDDAAGMWFLIIILTIIGIIFKFFKNLFKWKIPNEEKKMQYLVDKFMPLKNTIDKNWEREITDIEIQPPFSKYGYWTVKKYIAASVVSVIVEDDGFEIYKKTDTELELEMLKPEEDTPELMEDIDDLSSWNCKKCNEENEGSFDSCWKCQTLNE